MYLHILCIALFIIGRVKELFLFSHQCTYKWVAILLTHVCVLVITDIYRNELRQPVSFNSNIYIYIYYEVLI